MLATPERVRKADGRTVQVWHMLAAGQTCDGECDFHRIACSSEDGIVLPGVVRDVPVELDEPGQRWCADCLTIIRAAAQVDGGLDSLFRRLGPPAAET